MSKARKRLRKAAATMVAGLFSPMPTFLLEDVVARLVKHRARRLAPDAALRLLFRVDNVLYREQGFQSVRYGQGVHTKHRHMGYHDFFSRWVRRDERVLDVGCGIGAVAFHVAQQSEADVVGIDYDRENLEHARKSFAHPRVEYRFGDILEQMLDERFDVVILSNVLEHFHCREDLLRRLVLSTGAKRMLIRVPLFERDWRVPLKKELGVPWHLDMDHKIEHTLEQLREEVEAAGLRIAHQQVRWGETWVVAVPKTSTEVFSDRPEEHRCALRDQKDGNER